MKRSRKKPAGMALCDIVNVIRERTSSWEGHDVKWFERELAGTALLVEASGKRVHAVVVGLFDPSVDDVSFLDFSPCKEPCGAHGYPPPPRDAVLPSITFIVVTNDEVVYVRDETSAPTVAEA